MADEKEIWRSVPSAPDVEASSWGRVRQKPYTGRTPSGGERLYGGSPRTGHWDAESRRYTTKIRGVPYKVARLVCAAFNGPPPFLGAVCMHLDENARNNRPENLRWGTQRENLNFPGFLEKMRGPQRCEHMRKISPMGVAARARA